MEPNEGVCQFEWVEGCTANDALNYICDVAFDDDYCDGEGGEIFTNCCTDADNDGICDGDLGDCVIEDGTCEYPVKMWFDNVDRSSGTFEVWIYNNLPISELGVIAIEGVDITNITDITPDIGGASRFSLSSLSVNSSENIPGILRRAPQ